jgi:hypothetical protein
MVKKTIAARSPCRMENFTGRSGDRECCMNKLRPDTAEPQHSLAEDGSKTNGLKDVVQPGQGNPVVRMIEVEAEEEPGIPRWWRYSAPDRSAPWTEQSWVARRTQGRT